MKKKKDPHKLDAADSDMCYGETKQDRHRVMGRKCAQQLLQIEWYGKASWRRCPLSWVLNDRKEPVLEKRLRQRDSKCKGPAAGTSLLCVKNGRKADEQSACRGKGGEGDGEELEVSSSMLIQNSTPERDPMFSIQMMLTSHLFSDYWIILCLDEVSYAV